MKMLRHLWWYCTDVISSLPMSLMMCRTGMTRFLWLTAKFSMSPGTEVSPSSEQWEMQFMQACCLVCLHKLGQYVMPLKSTIRTCSLMHMYLFKWLQSKPAVMARYTNWDNVSFKEQHSWTASIAPYLWIKISSNIVSYVLTMLSNKMTTSFLQHCLL